MFDLTGRTALVTGATGGIGGAIAQALHAQGATVAISGTRREVLDTLAGKLGERTHVLPCNLSDAAEVEALVPAADLDPQSGVFHAITVGSVALRVGALGILAAILVTVGNAGGVGSTVAGIARVPFVVGIDRYSFLGFVVRSRCDAGAG